MSSQEKIELQIPTEFNAKEIKSFMEATWSEVRANNPELRRMLQDAGVDPDTAEFPFLYEQRAGAIGTTLLLLAGTLAIKLTFRVANDIWEKIILPELIRQYGERAKQWQRH